MVTEPKTLFISGAGFNLFELAGLIAYLNNVETFNIYAGTSSGAFLSASFVCGYSNEQLYDMCMQYHREFEANLSQSYLRLLLKGKLISCQGKTNFVSRLIKQSPLYQRCFKGRDPTTLTIKEVCDAGGKYFLCNATVLQTQDYELFSYWTTPELPLHFAVMSSMSLPPLFAPTVHPQSKLELVDGVFNTTFLPSVFITGTGQYYKNKYPSVDIPINLANAWGVLHTTPPDSAPLTSWSLKRLILSLTVFLDAFIDTEIKSEPSNFIQNRTWILNTPSVTAYPDISNLIVMYETGKNIGKSLCPKSSTADPSDTIINNTVVDSVVE